MDERDDIVTLLSATGEEIEFLEIAGIAHKGNFYAILQPVELLEGMDDDEALVFRVSRGANGEDKFEIELDDEDDPAAAPVIIPAAPPVETPGVGTEGTVSELPPEDDEPPALIPLAGNNILQIMLAISAGVV